MKYRKLRIAWSVAWGVVAVLLCVLWGRSYWHADDAVWTYRGNMYGIESASGSLRPFYNGTGSWPAAQWFKTERIAESQLSYDHATFGWDDKNYPTYFMAYFPHWIPTMVGAALAVAPWKRCSTRFSLRTLLIVTTLVAVVMGLVVWLSSD